MGFGDFIKKIGGGIKKAWNWAKDKAAPVIKKAWDHVSPLVKPAIGLIPGLGHRVERGIEYVKELGQPAYKAIDGVINGDKKPEELIKDARGLWDKFKDMRRGPPKIGGDTGKNSLERKGGPDNSVHPLSKKWAVMPPRLGAGGAGVNKVPPVHMVGAGGAGIRKFLPSTGGKFAEGHTPDGKPIYMPSPKVM
jgi:hypothetical protein